MGIHTIEVKEYKETVNHNIVTGGYRLEMLYCSCRDSPYEWIAHPAVFRSKTRAEAFAAKIDKVNLSVWGNDKPTYGVI